MKNINIFLALILLIIFFYFINCDLFIIPDRNENNNERSSFSVSSSFSSSGGNSSISSNISSSTSSSSISASSSLSYTNNWHHFGYDPCYNSYNPDETIITTSNINQLKKRWDIGGGDAYFSVISRVCAIYQGRLFISGAGSKLRAYSAQDGQLLWQFGDGNAGWAPQPVVSNDGTVYYLEGTSGLYYLYAVNAVSGSQKWKSSLSFDIGYNDTTLVTVDETRGAVYLVERTFGSGGNFYSLNKDDGSIVWNMSEAKDGMSFFGDYALLCGNKIFVKAEKNSAMSVFVIDADTHTVLDYYSTPYSALSDFNDISCILFYNNTLLIEFCDRDDIFKGKSAVYVYSINNHSELWHKEYSTPITGKIACDTVDNIVFIPTNPYLYAYNSNTGADKWTYTGYDSIFNPSIANGIVYFLSDSNMYALNEATGVKIFNYSLGYDGYDTTQVAINDGMLYFSGNGSPEGDFFALGF